MVKLPGMLDRQPAGFHAAFYKGTRPGVAGLYSRGVRFWMRGPYSHCEAVYSDGESASASFEDDGVRFKTIAYDPARWDFVRLPAHLELPSRQWFVDHDGELYDLRGNMHFVLGPVQESRNRKFCAEALAASLGIPDAWRFDPNALAVLLLYFSQFGWGAPAAPTPQSSQFILQP
jgi:hypothetical protein